MKLQEKWNPLMRIFSINTFLRTMRSKLFLNSKELIIQTIIKIVALNLSMTHTLKLIITAKIFNNICLILISLELQLTQLEEVIKINSINIIPWVAHKFIILIGLVTNKAIIIFIDHNENVSDRKQRYYTF